MRDYRIIGLNYNDLDIEKFIDSFHKYYKNKEKINLFLTILGTFMDTGTLFLPRYQKNQLLFMMIIIIVFTILIQMNNYFIFQLDGSYTAPFQID